MGTSYCQQQRYVIIIHTKNIGTKTITNLQLKQIYVRIHSREGQLLVWEGGTGMAWDLLCLELQRKGDVMRFVTLLNLSFLGRHARSRMA